jgi:uncharacterized protein
MRLITLLLALFLPIHMAYAERTVRSLLEIRHENLIMQQWDNSCAAAVLATILTYDKAFPITEEKVAQGMLRQTDVSRVRERGGFSLLEMKRYTAEIGFDSDGYSDMTLEDLAAQLPMIVPIKVRRYDHFVIVRKINKNEVSIADPGFGNYKMQKGNFAKVWPGIGFEVTGRIMK